MKLNEPSFPKGTIGYNEELEFIQAMRKNYKMGYGRMIQIIRYEWRDYLLKDGMGVEAAELASGVSEEVKCG